MSFKNQGPGAVDSSNALDLSESEEEEELEDIIEDFAVQVPIPTVCFYFRPPLCPRLKHRLWDRTAL